MKVLWFSNSPGNAIEYLKDSFIGSSWIPSLDKRIQRKVELHIAFYYPKSSIPFKYGDTTYHPIGHKHWKFKVIKDIFWKRTIDKQDLKVYLNIIDRVNPDLIHIHGTENSFGCIIPYTKIPVIVSIQGYLTVIEHKYLNGYSRNDLRGNSWFHGKSIKRHLLNESFYRVKMDLARRKDIEQKNLQSTNYIIGRTRWDRRVTSVLSPKSEYFHCDEMLREVFFETEWRPRNSSKLIIHSTLGNRPYKGFETICEALYFLNRLPGVKAEWQVAGIQEDDSIVRITRRKLRERYPNEALTFIGRVGGQKLAEVMCNADMFVSSSHIENSPNGLGEAMMIGMPCIATFSGGTGSLLSDGIEGILIQDGDPWVLTGAVLELFKNQDIACKYGREARKRALKRHNPDKIEKELLNIYRQIVSGYAKY